MAYLRYTSRDRTAAKLNVPNNVKSPNITPVRRYFYIR